MRTYGKLSVGLAVLAAALSFASIAGLGTELTAAQGGPVSGDVAIFYYPWYSTPARDGRWAHWYVEQDGTPLLSTPFYPTRGLYSSSNTRIVSAHMREIRAAGIGTVVVSWWGEPSEEADRLPFVTAVARRYGLQVAIHLEPYRGRTPASAAADIEMLSERGYSDFYVYDADRDTTDAWSAALEDLEGVRLFGHTTYVGRAKAAGFDGVYTYDVLTWNGTSFRRLCTQARDAGLLCAPSVGPGYDARLATRHDVVRPRLRGATYDHMWKAALRAKSDLVTITSYNEWQEGTQIEPAQRQIGRRGYDGAWGTRGMAARRAYLDATSRWTARLRSLQRQ
jgi:glycoprotein endo-alpha-1,2-mannosidase